MRRLSLRGKAGYSSHLQSTDLIQLYQSQLTIGNLRADQDQTRAIYQLHPIHQALKEYIPHPRLLGLFDQALLSPSSRAQEPNGSPASSAYSSTALIELLNQTEHTADRDAPPLEQSRLTVEDASEILSLKHQPSGYLPPKQDRARNQALSKGWRSIFAGGKDPRDPTLNGPNFVLAQVARDLIINQGWVLAFDEIQMVDVAGAGILSRVLEWYWRLGGVVIGTSNRLPERVQKSTVAPFLDRLKIKSPVVSLDSDVDWRLKLSLESLEGEASPKLSHWYQNVDSGIWNELVNSHLPSPLKTEVVVYGRKVIINRSDSASKSAVFTYQELCETALGPADYLKICSTFETIMIEGVPVFTTLMKNEGAQKTHYVIDAAYECSVKLFVKSNTSIDKLFFPDALDSRNQADMIELETLADVVEELSEPFRPNVSSYRRSFCRIRKTSIEELAIFKWTPLELDLTSTQSSSAHVKVDNPHHHINESETSINPTAQPIVSHQEENANPKDNEDESLFTRPKISEVHVWGIMKWGKRAGRWGQGAEIFNTTPDKKTKS
ncbi:hypothetical protein Pst134EA_032752 [Puccinia striiformis f. sp. tritici]|uniref:uncharacterized protein n=1 Tax=Puccinia striiformis f. sp. tritici TaxID=168172 RepID=UPI0020088649|nr:uncharacterized protein Pst134EA_032752 [Puccinia striiformis f. sp. tritici]KAH9441626.1 hypothetical protein Pst134EA_032752 [Puccinia striiformis f. sp. tritici]